MRISLIILFLVSILLNSCVGVSSSGIFGTGVSVAIDPRSLGTQIDDSLMQKSLTARILIMNKNYLISVKSKVLDGRIFLTGKVDNPEEKLKLTKLAWETSGVRSVRNDIKIKEEFNFQQSAKDILITSQLRSAMIFNKNIKATNYQIDTYKKKIYVYGIALSMFSIIGLIGMTGIIINDSIVLISTFNEYKKKMDNMGAIIKATCDRLRPILLTTLTTVFGLAPLLFEQSRDAQFLKPTVITLVFGLGFGMLILLIIVWTKRF